VGRLLAEKIKGTGSRLHVLDFVLPPGNQLIREVIYHRINLLEYDSLARLIKKIKPDKIFHLAASLDRIRDYNVIDDLLDANLKGINNLLRSLRDIDYTSFVYTSTSEVYGKQQKTPFKEDMLLNPASPYSLSKAAAELSLRTFSGIYCKPYTILRLFNVYGPDLPVSFFIPQLVTCLREGRDFDMTKGEQKRDFVYIDDIIDALILAAGDKKANNQIFNVCSARSISLKDLAIHIKNLIPSDALINFGAVPYRKNEIWDMAGSNEKIKNTLSFVNKTDFSTGLMKLIDA